MDHDFFKGKWATLLHIIKANVGTGILAMPNAMSNFGLVASAIGLTFLGIIAIYCMHLLVSCSKRLVARINQGDLDNDAEKRKGSDNKDPERSSINTSDTDKKYEGDAKEKREPINSLDYASTCEYAFKLGPRKVRKLAPYMRFIVNLLLVFTQFGFCCVYFMFVGKTISQVTKNLNVTELTVTEVMLIEWPLLIAINLFPSLKALSIITFVSCTLQAIGLASMFKFFFTGGFAKELHLYSNPDAGKWPLFFGTAMYSFEGIGVVLPLENEIKDKPAFRGCFGILNKGMILVVIFYLTIGICGYLKYGSEIKPSVTFNLPVEMFSEVIQTLFAIAIFLTYPIQMYVAFTFILPYLNKKLVNHKWNKCTKIVIDCFFRAVMVSITFGIASAVPLLDLVISFVGSFASSGLAIILPPIMHAICIWNEKDVRYKNVFISTDILIALFGIFGMVVGASSALKEIIEKIQSGKTGDD